MRQNDNRPATPGKSNASATVDAERSSHAGKSNGPQYFKATRALIFNDNLTPTEKLLVMAIGLHDWGDGRGGYPCNATLARACGLKADGPDKGMKSLRKLLKGLKDREYLRDEKTAWSKENPTGRVLFLLPKSFDERLDPGPTGPGREGLQARGGRAHRPGGSPGIQPLQIDPSFSSIDPEIDSGIATGEISASPSNDDDPEKTPAARELASVDANSGKSAEIEAEVDRAMGHIFGPVFDVEEIRARAELKAPHVEPLPPLPAPIAGAVDRAMVDVKQAASMAGEPINAMPSYDDQPEGIRRFLDDIGPDRRHKLWAMSRGKRRTVLAPHAGGYDEHLAVFQAREIDLVKVDARPVTTVEMTTEGLVQIVAEGDTMRISTLAESLCRDFGTAKDRRLWGAIHALCGQLWKSEVSPDAVLDAYRQAMGPKAENRGAVFTHALKAHGWRP